jgi:hypothetical protein
VGHWRRSAAENPTGLLAPRADPLDTRPEFPRNAKVKRRP